MDDTYLIDVFNTFVGIIVGCGLVAFVLSVVEKIVRWIIRLYRRARG